MPPEMIPCPKCGEANSAKKQVCYHCHATLEATSSAKSASRAVPLPQTKKPSLPPRTKKPSLPHRNTATAPQSSSTLSDYVFGVSLRDRAQFYRQMQSLLTAGIPVGLSLQYAADNCAIGMKSRIRAMSEHTQSGGAMSDAMLRYPVLFPSWEVNVVMAAEKSGTLPLVMHDIAEALEREWNLRSRTKVAAFPAMATFVVFVLVAMLVFSIGSYTTQTDFGGSVDFGGLFTSIAYRGFLLLVLVIALVVGWRMMGRTRAGGNVVSRIMPRVPMIGPILQSLNRIRFVSVLGTLWHAGIAPLQAIEIAARTTGDRRLIDQIAEASSRFGQGMTLSAIVAATDFLPQQSLYLLQTGETAGDISGALSKIAEYHMIDVEARVKTLPMKVQLILYAIIAPLVLWLMARVYGGYFETLLKI